MYRLPDLRPWCNQQCWLSSAGAMEFICLCVDGRTATCDDWLRLLRWEPGLVLWAAAGLQWRLDDPPQLTELAEWLQERAVSNLYPEHDDQHPETTSAELRAELARAAGGALAVARAAEMLAVDDKPRASRAVVQAMLRRLAGASDAPTWLVRCRSQARLPQQLEAEARRLAGVGAKAPLRATIDSATILQTARRDTGRRWLAVERRLPLGSVAHAIQRNQQLERRFAEQLHHEKLASLKELAYGASHEINNPLANVTMRAQALLREEQDPERRRMLEAIVSEGYRAHEMISDMMLFAKPPTLECTNVELVALIEETLREVEATPESRGATWNLLAVDESLVIHGERQHLGSALRGVFRNALEAVDGGGRIDVRVHTEGDTACIEVQDDGPGLTPRERRHLFDPFFSGREAGRGLGLGLSKAWTVVQQHGGDIRVLDGNPTRVVIRLPIRGEDAAV